MEWMPAEVVESFFEKIECDLKTHAQKLEEMRAVRQVMDEQVEILTGLLGEAIDLLRETTKLVNDKTFLLKLSAFCTKYQRRLEDMTKVH